MRKTERGQIRIVERVLEDLDSQNLRCLYANVGRQGTFDFRLTTEEADALHRAAFIGLAEIYKLAALPETKT